MRKSKITVFIAMLFLSFSVTACGQSDSHKEERISQGRSEVISVSQDGNVSNADDASGRKQSGSNLTDTPAAEKGFVPEGYWYPEDGDWTPWTEENGNIPYFTDKEKELGVFEKYSDFDSLGRCGVAFANVCQELMPTESRGEIGMVKPAGWHTVKYDCVNGKYLYNRCHLIGFQLAGENANELNLITGTRYLNIDGMLDHENEIASYVRKTNHHVLYRVTPIYDGDNLLCDGLLMEAWSVEDNGEGVCFCIYARNIQPGIAINYKTGDSILIRSKEMPSSNEDQEYHKGDQVYIINRSNHKFHTETCTYVTKMNFENREEYEGELKWLLDNGYEPCKVCRPEEK